MATDLLLGRARHRNDAGSGDGRTFEAVIDRKAEDKRETRGKASFHLVQALRDPLVKNCLVLGGFGVALRGRFGRELRDVVRPIGFGAVAQLGNTLDAVADLRTAVRSDRVFHVALVVIDEKPRRDEIRLALELHAVELHCARDRVACTAA